MPDREKIVKLIEEEINVCESVNQCYRTIDLPALRDILALLKEQEAVPVIQREIMHMLVWCCGSCGVAITDGDKFCRMCGKPVKWE